MNLKNVGSVTLSLVAVVCIALGGSLNASTLESGGAKVNAAQSEVPTPTEKTEPKNEPKAAWFWTICGSVALGFAEIVSRMLGESLAKRLLEHLRICLMKNWKKIAGFFKRKAQTNKAETTPQPFDVEQLSDAAIELLVYAALSQEKELRLQDNEIRFGLKPKTPAFYFDFPEQAPANSDVLAELVDCGALTQSRYKYVLNQEFVDKHLDAALEIDAQRIAHSLPEPGRQILNAARQEGGAVCCEHRSASSQAGFYAISAVAEHLGSAPALDVCRVLLMFQKNGLVNQWFLKEGPQSVPLFAPDDLPSHLKFNENAPTHGTITFIGGAPDRWKPYPRQSPNIGWNWAEGRLTKRGEEIAALLSPPAEPGA